MHASEQVVGLFERPNIRLAKTDDDGLSLSFFCEARERQKAGQE
jgi:hypothetical protein